MKCGLDVDHFISLVRMRTKSAIADFYGSSENGGEGEILENFTYNTQESLSRDFHDISLSKDYLGLGNCNWLLLFGFHTMQRYRSLLQLFVNQPLIKIVFSNAVH